MNELSRLDLPELIELLDRTRFERGMTWAQLAEEIGCDRQYLSKLVTGKRENPSANMLLSLLHWLTLTDVELGRLVQRITVTKEDS